MRVHDYSIIDLLVFSFPSTYNKQDVVLHLLLEYAEMDLNAVLKSHTTANRMATVLYFWNQMLEAVKVHSTINVCDKMGYKL